MQFVKRPLVEVLTPACVSRGGWLHPPGKHYPQYIHIPAWISISKTEELESGCNRRQMFFLPSEIFTTCNVPVKFNVDSATAFPNSLQTLESVSSLPGSVLLLPSTLPSAPFPTAPGAAPPLQQHSSPEVLHTRLCSQGCNE